MATFGENLKMLRKENRLTLDDLKNIVNTTKATLSRYENGKREPKAEFVEKVADYFNVSTDFILGKTDVRNYNKTHGQRDAYHPTLNKKDMRDIEKMTDNFLGGMDGDIMLNGEILDEEDLELFRRAVKNGLEYAKLMNKKKYTPKKYRK